MSKDKKLDGKLTIVFGLIGLMSLIIGVMAYSASLEQGEINKNNHQATIDKMNMLEEHLDKKFEEIQITADSDLSENIIISPETLEVIKNNSEQIRNLEIQLIEAGENIVPNVDLLLKESFSYYYAEEYEKAIAISDIILAIDSDNFRALNTKGSALNELGQYNEALMIYNKVQNINPDYVFTYNNIGTMLYKQGKYNEAEKYFDKALEIDKDYVEALSNKGATLYKLGEKESAKQYFEKALEIDPTYSSAKKWLKKY